MLSVEWSRSTTDDDLSYNKLIYDDDGFSTIKFQVVFLSFFYNNLKVHIFRRDNKLQQRQRQKRVIIDMLSCH